MLKCCDLFAHILQGCFADLRAMLSLSHPEGHEQINLLNISTINRTGREWHYSDVIMSAKASQITSLMIVDPTVYSGANQRKHQSSASLAFVEGNSPVTGEFPAQRASNAIFFPFDDVIMVCICHGKYSSGSFGRHSSLYWAQYDLWSPIFEKVALVQCLSFKAFNFEIDVTMTLIPL